MALTQISTAGVKDDAVTAGKIPANAVGSSELADNAVDNAAVASNAAIAGTKISPNFGSQNIATTGSVSTDEVNISTAASGSQKTLKLNNTNASAGSNEITFSSTTSGSNFEAASIRNGVPNNQQGSLQFKTANGSGLQTAVVINNDQTTTFNAGIGVTGNSTIAGNLDFPDNTSGNASLRLGNSQDFYLNHNGSNSYIINDTGNLYIRDLNGNVHIQGKDAEEGIIVKADNAVELYHDNVKKFETGTNYSVVTGISNGNPAGLKITNSDANSNYSHAELRLISKNGASYGVIYNDHANGNVRIGHNTTGSTLEVFNNGNIRSQGIVFGSDTASANHLDDYEEGTWTPVYVGGSGSIGSITYSIQSGFYRKIGNLVYIEGALRAQVTNNSTGTYDLGGLPFTINSSSNGSAFQCFNQASWIRAPHYFAAMGGYTLARAREGINFGASTYTNGASDAFSASSTSSNRTYFSGVYIT